MGKSRHIEYEIQYTKAADKFFEKHRAVREQYENALKELLTGDNPEKVDLKRIQGKGSTYYRIRLGDYRVVFAIINGKIVVISLAEYENSTLILGKLTKKVIEDANNGIGLSPAYDSIDELKKSLHV